MERCATSSSALRFHPVGGGGGFHPSRPPRELSLVFPTINIGMLRTLQNVEGKLRLEGSLRRRGERWRKRRHGQVGKSWREGRKEGWRGGGKEGRGGCDAGSAEDEKQCWLRGGKRPLWLLSVTQFHYKQACLDSGFKKRKKKKKLDNFQRRNLKCNKSAGETTKGRG